MAIIRYTKDATIRYAYLNIFPDQFKTDKEKQDESWIKNTMDYFANKAYAEYVKTDRQESTRNKNFVKATKKVVEWERQLSIFDFISKGDMILSNEDDDDEED